MDTHHSLAIDLGASSGRAVVGSLAGSRLTLRELHRFPNGPVRTATGLHWDAKGLLGHITRALSLAASSNIRLSGMGIDTWGVDYGLLSETGELLEQPFHYRDPRTSGMMEAAFAKCPKERIYAITGVQFMPLNTLYQLLADQRSPARPLERARSLLFMPDLLGYWLTGIERTEHTIASTSQFFDTQANTWSNEILGALELPTRILPPIAAPGSLLGSLLPSIAAATGAGPIPVLCPASHDTGSAVAAVPATTPDADWAYISSGTWSLVGRELSSPVRTARAMAANFTNESGLAGTIRFHKNVAGLWLLQECQRVWKEQGNARTFEQLCEAAMYAPPLRALVDPDHPSFAEFGDMPARIGEYCVRTDQEPPAGDGAVVRCVLESLALKYRVVIEALESITGPVRRIHIVGGGVQNQALCQFTADATGRPVLAGPVEATAIGNIMAQALAQGRVSSLAQIRAVVAESFPPVLYTPRDVAAWGEAAGRFGELLQCG